MSDGLRFECTMCGKCCTNHGEYAHVYVNVTEVAALARDRGLSVAEFEGKYAYVDDGGWTQLKLKGERCVFLQPDGGCQVYAARPIQCSTFPFWPELVRNGEWTAEARELCEGVGRGNRYSSREAERLVCAMKESDREE